MATHRPSSAPEWRDAARRFAEQEVAPRAEAMDRDDAMPAELRQAMVRSGLMGVGIRPEHGGGGGGALAVALVLEELSRASAAVATLLSVHLSVAAAPIERFGTPAQRERYLRPLAEGRALGAFALTEPGVGSDAAHLACRYRGLDPGYELSGSKMFITNAAIADTILTFATRDPSLGHRGISAFLVCSSDSGFSIAQHLDKLGLRGSETNEIVLDHLRLDADRRLGPEGEGLSVALDSLTGGRVGIAACALGVAESAFEEMVRSARGEPAEWKGPVVARAYTELEAARQLVYHAAAEKEAARPFVELASAAKLAASRTAVSIAEAGLAVAGRPAARAGSRAERLLRDARVFPIVEGTTEIQELILGRALLGGSTEPTTPEPPG